MKQINVRPLSIDLQKIAEEELNEVPKNVVEDIRYIRTWLKQQHHLNVNPDDQFILTFLRGSKFNYEKTKQKIDSFYSTKTLVPEYLRNRNPLSPGIQEILKTGRFWLPLPKFSDPTAPRLLYNFGKPFEPSEKIDNISLMKTNLIVLDILLHEDDCFIVNGYSIIQYVNGFSVNHLSQVPIRMLQNSYTCTVKRYPARLKSFYFVNVPSTVHTVYNIIKPFVSQKIQSRVTFCETNDFKEIHAVFSKAELPVELGGENYSVKTVLDEWKAKIEKLGNWLVEEERFCSDESKRNGKVNYDADIFSVQGSFKRLELD